MNIERFLSPFKAVAAMAVTRPQFGFEVAAVASLILVPTAGVYSYNQMLKEEELARAADTRKAPACPQPFAVTPPSDRPAP